MSEIDSLIVGPGWPVTYNADGLATVHNCDFVDDPTFAEAYRLGAATATSFAGVDARWRVFICCWAAFHAKKIGGDFVECGVNTGFASRAVMHYIDFSRMDQRFFLLDTYSGVPAEQISEDERSRGIADYGHLYPDCYTQVCETFRDFANVRIIRGEVPGTLSQIDSERIAYVSIDMNIVAPEIAAGEFLWPRLVQGAMVVLDDYGWRPHVAQKHAWDRFAEERGVKVLALPTGQGLIVKS